VTAQHWAYDHNDPHELIERIHPAGTVYSLDQKHYIPLCGSCHKLFDNVARPRACLDCAAAFLSVRADAKYCSARCRQRAHVKRKSTA